MPSALRCATTASIESPSQTLPLFGSIPAVCPICSLKSCSPLVLTPDRLSFR